MVLPSGWSNPHKGYNVGLKLIVESAHCDKMNGVEVLTGRTTWDIRIFFSLVTF